MFERSLMQDLIAWQQRKERLPLIIRGARQVGKTSLIRLFAQHCFDDFFEINFELDKAYKACFTTFDPQEIISNIEKLSNQKITPGKTLLFLDEIQECVPAISALRYFKEKCPQLHVISAGSLLEFALESKQLKMPVGRVEFLYLYPLSFNEFLLAQGKHAWHDILTNISLSNKKNLDLIHGPLLKLFNDYLIIGGMPNAIREYNDTHSFLDVQRLQSHILLTYENDFSKYAISKAEEDYIQMIYERLPALVAENFKFTRINSDVQSRSLKPALYKLIKAQVIHPVYATSASGLPLKSLINPKKFKLLMSDVGLYCASMQLSRDILIAKNVIIVNKGTLAEQVVGQEIIANSISFTPYQLTYWSRDVKSSKAKIDYVIQHETSIIPIEVKAGSTGQLKSLHMFMDEKKSPLGIKISSQKLALNKKILCLPLYLVNALNNLINESS